VVRTGLHWWGLGSGHGDCMVDEWGWVAGMVVGVAMVWGMISEVQEVSSGWEGAGKSQGRLGQ